MSELRELVIEAHGGHARWKRFRAVDAEMSITGLLWAKKGWPDALKKVRVTADLHDQQVSYSAFTGEGLRSRYRPDKVAIETSDGNQVKSRRNLRTAFDGHKVETGWDDLHLAYFSGYSIWNYLTTPFLFALPGFGIEEIAPIQENGERRRRLKLKFPDAVVTHCPEQVFYIDDNGLIARLDYSADVTGGVPMAHYTSAYREFDGIRFPTQRRAFRRNAEGSAITSAVSVAIDISEVRLS